MESLSYFSINDTTTRGTLCYAAVLDVINHPISRCVGCVWAESKTYQDFINQHGYSTIVKIELIPQIKLDANEIPPTPGMPIRQVHPDDELCEEFKSGQVSLMATVKWNTPRQKVASMG